MQQDRLASLVQSLSVEAVGGPELQGAKVCILPDGAHFAVVVASTCPKTVAAIRVNTRAGDVCPLASMQGFRFTATPDTPAFALVGLLVDELKTTRCGRQTVLTGYAEALLIHLLRRATEEGVAETGLFAGLADPQLARVLTLMHDRPDLAWRTEALAEEAGMSRSAFMARFRDVVGVSPMTYLRNWRLSRAAIELDHGARVSEVARRLGYRSDDAFTRAFRQATGQLPSARRKSRAAQGTRHPQGA
ncbi:hypothetical protein ACMU_00685 [Actibacterium mucosum KCTC 23349]|uniref:HTH araC/xylS-type domain-containing protein n=1 Tax=Actibacterium mucosum KCTC 23349 TaxID=1454373 RepID=A0A037ZN19_9RHOB|nr:helix-turn-helix transcriptional regulator [Actibacterium mucosum]KAJ57040.1 hypothetical protein ACMU_00685 [Actibacterium mucosum KCTC 23349]